MSTNSPTAPNPKPRKTKSRAPALTWTTEITHTRHRWWWYLVIVWIGWTLSLLLLTSGNWSAALVVAVATIGLLVINTGKPRAWTVTIRDGIVAIERVGDRQWRYELPLDRYRGFTVVEMPKGKRDEPQKAIALLPRPRLGRAQLIVLPHDTHEADMIIQQFTDLTPYETAESFRRVDRLLNRATRWLGLS